MSTVILFTENNTRILQNPDDLAQYRNNPNAIIDPDLSEVVGTPPHLWKLLDGKVVQMHKYEAAKRINHIETFGVINTPGLVKLNKFKKIYYSIKYAIIDTAVRIKDSVCQIFKSAVETGKTVVKFLAGLPIKTLDFCNVLDYNKRLSITNIALIALLGKLLLSTNTDWPSLVSVIVAFSNYAHKRVVSDNDKNK